MIKYVALLALSMALSACSNTKASGTITAQVVQSPTAGYSCFAIVDGNGSAVGGNCSKD